MVIIAPNSCTDVGKHDTLKMNSTKNTNDHNKIGDKNSALAALKDSLTSKTQWTDHMEEVLSLITINPNVVDAPICPHILTHATFPYRICDFPLPQYNTGYFYMLLLVKDKSFTCMDKTMSICKRIQQHDSGVGSTSTEPLHLRPCALLAHLSGFNSRNNLLLFVETK